MITWQVSFISGEAKGYVWVNADSASAAKNSAFNQFLGLEKTDIMWTGTPTFWAKCVSVKKVEEIHKEGCQPA